MTITHFKKIDALALNIVNNTNDKFNPEGFTKNVTRLKVPLHQCIVLSRKKFDASETNSFFHNFTNKENGQVCLLADNAADAGIDVAIDDLFLEHHRQQQHQKNTAGTPNDGLRLAVIVLDPKHRSAVSDMMTKKKGRKKSDLTGDPHLH